MSSVRVASYNVENLVARPRAFDPTDLAASRVVQMWYSAALGFAPAALVPVREWAVEDLNL